MRNFYVFCFLVSGICFSGTTNADPKCLTKSELTPSGSTRALTGLRCYAVTKTVYRWLKKSENLIPLESYKPIDDYCEYEKFLVRNVSGTVLTDEDIIMTDGLRTNGFWLAYHNTKDDSHLRGSLEEMKICNEIVRRYVEN